MLAIILSSLVLMFASLIGVIFTWGTLEKFIEKNMGLLVSFSAGVFLVVVLSLGAEVVTHSSTIAIALLWIALGAAGVSLLFKLIPGFHHHHGGDHESHSHSPLDARRIIFSDALHNVGDGVLLAASFAVSIPVGIAATVSIFVHEIIQEISEFFVLRQAGFSVKKSLAFNFAASSTVLIGAVGGYFLLDTFSSLEIPLLAISAGAFLVVVLQDLIPESIRHSKVKKNYSKHIALFIIGSLVMFGFSRIVGQGHSHGHDVGHENEYGAEHVEHTNGLFHNEDLHDDDDHGHSH